MLFRPACGSCRCRPATGHRGGLRAAARGEGRLKRPHQPRLAPDGAALVGPRLAPDGAALVGPRLALAAERVRAVAITLRTYAQGQAAQLCWAGPDGVFSEAHSVVWLLIGDGRAHVTWAGSRTCSGVQPSPGAGPGTEGVDGVPLLGGELVPHLNHTWVNDPFHGASFLFQQQHRRLGCALGRKRLSARRAVSARAACLPLMVGRAGGWRTDPSACRFRGQEHVFVPGCQASCGTRLLWCPA